MKSTGNMTTGRPFRLLVGFAVPLMAGDLCQQLYTLVDGAVVGRLLGLEAFAAIGAAGFLYWLAFVVILAFTHGFEILLAQRFGAGNQVGVRKALAMSLVLGGAAGLVLGAACALAASPVLAVMNTPSELQQDAALYLRVLFAGLWITFSYNMLAAAFRAFGDSATPLRALLVSTALNILLDIVLVLATPLGVAAVAVATLLAQLFAVGFCWVKLAALAELFPRRADFRFDRETAGTLLRLGAPLGLRDCLAALGGAVIQYVVNGYGTAVIAGVTAAKKLYSLLFLVGGGMEGATATFLAQNFGAGRYDRMTQGVKVARRILLAGAAAIAALALLLGRRVLGLFLAGSPAAVDAGMGQLTACLILLPALYLLFLYRSGLQSMGNTVMPLVSGVIETVVRIAAALALPRLLGVAGIYLAEAAAWPVMAVQLYIAYRVVFQKIAQGGKSLNTQT